MTKKKTRQYMVVYTHDTGEDKKYDIFVNDYSDCDSRFFGSIEDAKAAITEDGEDHGYAVEYKVLEVIQTVPVKPDFGGN